MNRRLIALIVMAVLAVAVGCDDNDPTATDQQTFQPVTATFSSGGTAAPATAAAEEDQVVVTLTEFRLWSPGGETAELISEPTDVDLTGDVLEGLTVPEGTYSCVDLAMESDVAIVDGGSECTGTLPVTGTPGEGVCSDRTALEVSGDGSYEVLINLPSVSGSCPSGALSVGLDGASVQFAN